MKENKKIEQLFRREFESFEIQPSPKVWKGVRSDLFIKNFFHFSPWSLNAWYIGGLLVIASLTLYSLNPVKETSVAVAIPEIETPASTSAEIAVEATSLKPANSETQKAEDHSTSLGVNPVKTDQSKEPEIIKAVVTAEPAENVIVSNIPDKKSSDYYAGQSVVAWFECNDHVGCVPFRTKFNNLSQNAVRFSWSFGDGGNSELADPVYIFDEPGTWFVSLTAWSANNEVSIFTDSIQVDPVPEARFSMDIQGLTGNEQAVYFYNYSRGAEKYLWDFGDGSRSAVKDPDHFFKKKSGGNIKLIAISEAGCADSTTLRDAFQVGEPELIFPTAFSPSTTGPATGHYSLKNPNNNIFHPYVEEDPEEYQLKIFNRSGILIFESNDIKVGWTGYYHEELLPQGVYVWKARAKFSDGRSVVKIGDVTLLWGE